MTDKLQEAKDRCKAAESGMESITDENKETVLSLLLLSQTDVPWLIAELEKSQAKVAGVEKMLAQRRTSISDYRRVEKEHLDAWQVELARDYRNAARAEEHLVKAVEGALKG